jgi:cell division protease FtsH
VSIIPRGIGALGYNIQRPTEDRYLMNEDELMDKMAVLMGGRAAETLVFNKLSTGAADDLSQATNIARTMVTRYGMNETLGHVSYAEERSAFLVQTDFYAQGMRNYSEETAAQIDAAVRELVETAFEKATVVLEVHRQTLDKTAKLLLAKETLSADELPSVEPYESTSANLTTGTSISASVLVPDDG